MTDHPAVQRVRHELKRRTLTVARVERYAPKMVRVVLTGPELAGFTSLGFDDHVKLFFPTARADNDGNAAPDAIEYEKRDFTPRHFDADAGELWIDFFLHDAGPAATWAAQADAGQTLMIGGPRGSAVVSLDGIDAHVLVGDETAIPAISRRLLELPADARALVVLETEPGDPVPAMVSRAMVDTVQVARDGRPGAPAHELIDRLRSMTFPPGRSFVWVALESQSARSVRRYLCDERGMAKHWVKAAGYWQRGSAGSHELIADAA